MAKLKELQEVIKKHPEYKWNLKLKNQIIQHQKHYKFSTLEDAFLEFFDDTMVYDLVNYLKKE